MQRAAALALVLLTAGLGPAAGASVPERPEAGACHQAGLVLITLEPSIPLPLDAGGPVDALLKDGGHRWPLAATAFTFADESRKHGAKDVDWRAILGAADVLERCFQDDPAKAGGRMLTMKQNFDAIFPPERREELRRMATEGAGGQG